MSRRPVFPLLNVTLQHYNIMTRLFNAEWSARKVQTYMSGQGMGYRWDTILATRRKVLGLLKKEGMFQAWKPGKIIHKGYFEESEFRAPFKYRINYWIDCEDSITGQITREARTGLFDTFINPDQIAGEIMSRIDVETNSMSIYQQDEFSGYGGIIIRNVEHQAGAPY